MEKHLIEPTENVSTHVDKQYFKSIFYFEYDDIEQIWVFSGKDCVAELYVCEDTGYDDKIYVGITLNPKFQVDLNDLESAIIDFLINEREYNVFNIDVELSPSSGDSNLWKNYKF
jgi:hypothetical protein